MRLPSFGRSGHSVLGLFSYSTPKSPAVARRLLSVLSSHSVQSRIKVSPESLGRSLGALTLLVLVLCSIFADRAAAAPCDPPIANAIVCENSKPGNPPSEWDVSGSGDANIQGFATDISADQGQTVKFKVKTPASDYRLDIYRMGYYGGNGARKVATVQPSATLPQTQPACLTQSATGLIDCGNWAQSASWTVPADAVSGIYFAKLVREDGSSGGSHIFFVVRDDDGELQPSLPDLRHHLAGLQPVRRQQPLRRRARHQSGPRLQGQLQPPAHCPRHHPRGLAVQRRVPDGSLAGAQRL